MNNWCKLLPPLYCTRGSGLAWDFRSSWWHSLCVDKDTIWWCSLPDKRTGSCSKFTIAKFTGKGQPITPIPDLFHCEGGLFMSSFSLPKLGCYSLCSPAPATGLVGPLSGAASWTLLWLYLFPLECFDCMVSKREFPESMNNSQLSLLNIAHLHHKKIPRVHMIWENWAKPQEDINILWRPVLDVSPIHL